MNELDYLRAELAKAQQEGITTTSIRVAELQSLLDQMADLLQLPRDPVKLCGFAKPGELKQLYTGTLRAIRVRRTACEWYSQAVYNETKELHQ